MKTFDPTKPVQTRDGRKATIIKSDRRDPYYPIITIIEEGECESLQTHTAEGKYSTVMHESVHDLINIPEKVKVKFWVNVNRDGFTTHWSRETADQFNASQRIACFCVEREITEGEGL